MKTNLTLQERDTVPGIMYAMQPDGLWTVYEAGDELPPAPDNTQANENARIDAIWQAAHDYEFASINGSAIGMVTMGIMQGLPKCQAVHAWVKSIWVEYYIRKANGSTDTDYSMCGPMPYSIPELMIETAV